MYKTEQENFWKGTFGDDYVSRNTEETCLSGKIAFWSNILSKTSGVQTCIEYVSNIGLNLKAIKMLHPQMKLNAVEINDTAVEVMKNDPNLPVKIFHDSILDVEINDIYDLAFTMGVLIHINPNELKTVYEKLYTSSKKYMLIAEYYNPSPVEIPYRGNKERLFKRDFAGEFLDMFPDCKLEDYGFVYHRDNNFPLDDITWFLMKKEQ